MMEILTVLQSLMLLLVGGYYLITALAQRHVDSTRFALGLILVTLADLIAHIGV